MKFRALVWMAALAVALVSIASAADVTGKWTAQVPGRGGQTRDVTFTFKQDGSSLTGSMTGRQGDVPISDGKVDGDNISFNVTMNFGGNEVKMMYKGKLSGNEIKFTREGGQGGAQEFTAKRATT